MSCELQQQAFAKAMNDVQQSLERELADIAAEAARKAKEVSDEFEQGNDLSAGVGAAAGTTVGGFFGGPSGAAAGALVGKTIGSLFVLEVTYQEERIALDVPRIEMANQDWKYDMPTVVMRDNDIIFDIPTLVMKRVEGPRIPHVTVKMVRKCIGGGWSKICTNVPQSIVTWEQTYLDVPTYESKRHRIVVGVPEVEMREQRIVVSVPQVSMERQEILFKIPGIRLQFVKDAGKKAASAATDIASRASTAVAEKKLAMKERIRAEVIGPATQMFACFRNEIQEKRQGVAAMFEPEIGKLTDSLKNLIANGVPTSDDDYVRQEATLNDAIAKRDAATANFDAALLKLDEEAKMAIEKLLNFED